MLPPVASTLPSGRHNRTFVADAGGGKDAFGHTQLGGVASYLAARVKDELGFKVHWTLPDYLQRSARHIASKTDLAQAQAVVHLELYLRASEQRVVVSARVLEQIGGELLPE